MKTSFDNQISFRWVMPTLALWVLFCMGMSQLVSVMSK